MDGSPATPKSRFRKVMEAEISWHKLTHLISAIWRSPFRVWLQTLPSTTLTAPASLMKGMFLLALPYRLFKLRRLMVISWLRLLLPETPLTAWQSDLTGRLLMIKIRWMTKVAALSTL